MNRCLCFSYCKRFLFWSFTSSYCKYNPFFWPSAPWTVKVWLHWGLPRSCTVTAGCPSSRSRTCQFTIFCSDPLHIALRVMNTLEVREPQTAGSCCCHSLWSLTIWPHVLAVLTALHPQTRSTHHNLAFPGQSRTCSLPEAKAWKGSKAPSSPVLGSPLRGLPPWLC